MLFATAVSDLSIADALAEPRYRPALPPARAGGARRRDRRAGAVRRLRPRRPRRLDRPPRRVQPRLGEDALGDLPRPRGSQAQGRDRDARRASTGRCSRRTLELIHEIEDGRRVCEVANLDLLAAYAAPRASGAAAERGHHGCSAVRARVDGPLHGVPVAVKDNIDVRGVVTTNASTVGVPPPAGERRDGRRAPARRPAPSSSARRTCSSTRRAA